MYATVSQHRWYKYGWRGFLTLGDYFECSSQLLDSGNKVETELRLWGGARGRV